MDAVSAVVTIPAASTTTPPPLPQTLASNNSVNQSNNNNNLHTATTAISISSSNSLNSIGVSSNSNSSCSSSSTSSNSSSSGYGSTTTTPTNNYDLQTTPTTTPVPTTPIAIAEPIIPVATIAAVTPFYNEALTTQHNLETHHLHHQHQQHHYPHPHLLASNHHQLPPANLQTTTPQHQQQQQHHPQYLSRQQYYSSYDYQQPAAPTHNVAAVAGHVGYNMGIAGTSYELSSPAPNTTAYNAGQYKSNFAGAINYERTPLVGPTKATNFNQQQTPPPEQQQQPQSKVTKQRSASSLIGNSTSTNTSKPQAAATPFYAQPITPTAHSNPTTFYDHLKHKMSLEYGHEAYNNPSAIGAASYHQQQQKYYAAKTQLKEAACGSSTNINNKNLYPNSNSFFAAPGATHSTYDKYGSMYPQVPQTGFTTSGHLGNETPPDFGNYRKPIVVNSVNSPSWPWGIDYASGNSRTIPPPNSHLPTATVAPTHATYLPPQPTTLARDPYYMATDKYGAVKYDKYPGMSYQQPYVSPSARSHHMWANTAHASNLTPLNERSLLASTPAAPAPHSLHTAGYFPTNSNNSLNSRQSCCSQPYQTQSCFYPPSHTQPPQRLPLNQTPPANAPSAAGYLSAQPSMGPSSHLNALSASCKYGSGIMPDFGNGSKMKTTNDLYLNSHPYDNNSSSHNYGFGTATHASNQQLYASNAHAQSMAHGLTPSTLLSHDPLNANPASYTNDLSLTTSNFDNYHTHLEPHLSTQNMTGIHGQQQPPPPAYGPTVAKRALLDYRKPIQPQPPPALTEECYSTLQSRDHYNQQELLNTPETTTTFEEYETAHTDNTAYIHSSENLTETDKSTEEGNKNISLRDFLANWNDDEDEYQNTEELSFEQAAVIEEVLQTAPEEAAAAQIVEQQDTEIVKEKDSAKTKLVEENKKLQENLSATDINQYVNLPDIVIDIEKSGNANNSITTPTTSPTPPKVLKTSDNNASTLNLNNFDVEKELDELKLKRPSSQELTKDFHDIKETKSVSTPQSSPTKQQLTTQLSFDDLNLEPANKTVLNTIPKQNSKPQSTELNEQYFKDLEGYESGSSRHSNESAFEKEYETFINKFSSESSTDKNNKDNCKSELEKEVDFEQNVQDFSKFYKRKRKLKEDDQKTIESQLQNQKKVKTSEAASISNSNFPQVYTKKSRNRLVLKKTQTPRKRKPLSVFYKVIHSIRRLGLYRSKRVKEYMTELKEKHLPLIKRQSIKNYTHGLTQNAYNVKSLKALCIMTINTEEFRKILTRTPEGCQDNCSAEVDQKHICTDPTCETCEVIKSLMEAESIEESIMQQAAESSLKNPKVTKAIILEVDSNELITIVENVEDIGDLHIQLEEAPTIISNEIENVQYSNEHPMELETNEIIEHLVHSKSISDEISDVKVISKETENIQHSKEISTEFEDKTIENHSTDSESTNPILKEISDTEVISSIIENVKNSREFTNEFETNEITEPSQEAIKQVFETNCSEDGSSVINFPNKNSLEAINSTTEDILAQSNKIKTDDLNEEEVDDDVAPTKSSKEDITKSDATEILQEIPNESKIYDTPSSSPNLETENDNIPKTKNVKSESEDTETSESDSESSSSSSTSSSSDDDSVGSKSSVKKSASSDGSSDTNTESDSESDRNASTSNSSDLETKQENRQQIKTEIKINQKEPAKNTSQQMDVDTNSDSDSENEAAQKSPKRIVMRFKKSSISSKSSPNQNSSIEQVSDYSNKESDDEKHFEVISSTTLKLRRKRKILLKIPKSKVDFSNRTDSDSEYSDNIDKKSENTLNPMNVIQEGSFKEHLSTMESNADNQSDNNEITEKKSSTNLDDFEQTKTLDNNHADSLKEQLSMMTSNSESESENNEILERHSNISNISSSKDDTINKDPTFEDSESDIKCEDNLESLQISPKLQNEVGNQNEIANDEYEISNKISTPLNVSPQQNYVKEDVRKEDIAFEKSLESYSETEDFIEKSHLKSPTIVDLFPQPPTKCDHLSESDEDEIISENKNDFNETPLTPRLDDNYSSKEHAELNNESESYEDELFKGKELNSDKSPQIQSESVYEEESIFKNDISECQKEIKNPNPSAANLIENIPITDSFEEDVLNRKKINEGSFSNEIIEKSTVEDLPNDKIQNRDEVEHKIYNIMSDSEKESQSLEISLTKLHSKKDYNISYLSDSERYSYFEYENDDDENRLKKPLVSKPTEIYNDDHIEISEETDKSEDSIKKSEVNTDDQNSDKIQSNINNIHFEKSDIEEINVSQEMCEEKETVTLAAKQDYKLCENENIPNIESRSPKECFLNTKNRKENSILESDESQAIEHNIKECEQYSGSDESDVEIDVRPQTSHENPIVEQYISSEHSDSDINDIPPHEIQSEEKLSDIPESLIHNPIEFQTKAAKKIYDCAEIADDVESSTVLDNECKNFSEKSKTAIVSPTHLEEIPESNSEESTTESISLPNSNNSDITKDIFSKECLKDLAIEKFDIEIINTTSEEKHNQQESEENLEQKTYVAKNSEVYATSMQSSLEIADTDPALKESKTNSINLEEIENIGNTVINNNLNISTNDSHRQNVDDPIDSPTNSEDFEDIKTEEFTIDENNLKTTPEEIQSNGSGEEIESSDDCIKIPESSITESKPLNFKDDNETFGNNTGCLRENLEVIPDQRETNKEILKECDKNVHDPSEYRNENESIKILEKVLSSEDQISIIEENNSVTKSTIDNSIAATENVLENPSSSEDSVSDIAEKMSTESEVEKSCSNVLDSLLQKPTDTEIKETFSDEIFSQENHQDHIDKVNTLDMTSDCVELANDELNSNMSVMSVDSDITVHYEKISENSKNPSTAINEVNYEYENLNVKLVEKDSKHLQQVVDPSLPNMKEKSQSLENVEETNVQSSMIANDKFREIENKSVLPVLHSTESSEFDEKSEMSPLHLNEMCEISKSTEGTESEVLEEIENNSIQKENETRLSPPIAESTSEFNSLTSKSLEGNLNQNKDSKNIVKDLKFSNIFEKCDEIFDECKQKLPSASASLSEKSLGIKENDDNESNSETESGNHSKVIAVESPKYEETSPEDKNVDVRENQTEKLTENQIKGKEDFDNTKSSFEDKNHRDNETETSTENSIKDKEPVENTENSFNNKINVDKETEPNQLSSDHPTSRSEDVCVNEHQFDTLSDEELEAHTSLKTKIKDPEESESKEQSIEHHKNCSEETESKQQTANHQNQIKTSNNEELIKKTETCSDRKIQDFEKSKDQYQSLTETKRDVEESSNSNEGLNKNSQSHEVKSTDFAIEPKAVASKITILDKTPLEQESRIEPETSTYTETNQVNGERPIGHQLDIPEVNANSITSQNTLDKDSVSQGELSGDFYGFKNQSSFEDESGDFHGFEDLEEVTRIRREIENFDEDSAANDGFLSYPSLNRDLYKTSTTSLISSSSSELNELEALEKELSQHQPEMAVEDDEEIETELLNECTKVVSTNDIEHIKQMLESDDEPQVENQSNKEDKLEADANDDADKFVVISKNSLNDIISSNNSLIPKLSDLCRAALNSSLNSNTSNLAQQHNTDITANMTPNVMVERELSVEEALAEMYRQVGVLSDPEDNVDTDNTTITGDTEEAHDVLLFNLQEILNSDNNDVYVLQCDMNEENILNVVQTNDEPQRDDEIVGEEGVQSREVTNTERVNTVQFIGILDTQSTEPQIHIISSDSESEVIILSDDESDIGYRPFLARHERITIPFINDHDIKDNDSLSDISTIHHEEIVPENLNKFLQEEFYKYLHEKYVQRNISKYYHANRILKKYKKRFINAKRQ